jgi:serine/threonine protein kinase
MKTEVGLFSLSLDDLDLLDGLCNRLASSESNGGNAIADLVAEIDEPLRSHFLRELLWQDIEQRNHHGKSVAADHYSFVAANDNRIAQEVFDELEKEQLFLSLGHPTDLQPLDLPSRYEKVGTIGQGGIGLILRVLDRHSQRPLAIKKLRDKYRKDRRANLRLEREAILTGSLQHPGIPPVHDHGLLADSSVFFAMKLVDGTTLAEILDGRSKGNDDLPSLIGIFEQVAQTVAYAHAEQVVHRDLKPQNIMVGKFGEVQVMDWGMGKRIRELPASGPASEGNQSSEPSKAKPSALPATETKAKSFDSSFYDPMTSITETGEVFGTPAYMAPEQAKGQVEAIRPSTDVFGLGAILFEILTHSRLYEQNDAGQVLVMAAKGDQRHARTKLEDSGASPELVELCLRCLEVDQAKRFQDADQVADAITAYQDGVQTRLRTAEAERTAAEVQASEERKRRRTATWLTGAIALTFIAGLAGVLWQLNIAVNAKQDSDKYAALADARFLDAKRTVDEYLTEVSNSQDLLASTPGTEKLRRKLLEKAKSYYESFVALKPDDPIHKDELAQSYLSLGMIIQQLGSESESEPYFQDCIRICEELIASGQEQPETKRRILQCQNFSTRNLITVGKIDEGIESAKVSLEFAKKLAAENPDDVHCLCSVARTQFNIGTWSLVKKRPDAVDYIDDATLESEQLMLRFPDSATAQNTRAIVLVAMGSAYHDQAHQLKLEAFHTGREGDQDKAKKIKLREKQIRLQSQQWLQEAFDILAIQLQLDPEDSDLKPELYNNIPTTFFSCASRLSLAFLYDRDKSDPEDFVAKEAKAASIVRDAMQRVSDFSNRNPYLLKEKLLLIESHRLLAIMTGLDERIEILEDGMELTRKEISKHPDSIRLYRMFNELGLELVRWQREKSLSEAELETRQEMLVYSQVLRKLVGQDDPEVVKIVIENQMELANLQRRAGKLEEAISEYDSAVAIILELQSRGKTDQATRVLLAEIYGSQARMLSQLGRHQDAVALKRTQIEIYQTEGDNDVTSKEFFEHGRSLSGLVSMLLESEQWERAIETANESREIIEASENKSYRGPGKFVLGLLCFYRAAAYEKLERYEDAKQELTDLEAFGRFGVPDGIDCGWLHTKVMICRADVRLGNVAEALQRATEITENEAFLGQQRKGISRVLLEAAAVFSLAAENVATDESLDESTKAPLIQQHCDKSIDLIKLAIKQDDFLDPLNRSGREVVEDKIREDAAFESIRERQELKGVLVQERLE